MLHNWTHYEKDGLVAFSVIIILIAAVTIFLGFHYALPTHFMLNLIVVNEATVAFTILVDAIHLLCMHYSDR